MGRFKTVERLFGEDGADMVAVIGFPDAETIKNMLGSDDFKALADSRAKAFTKVNPMISERM